ncbi:MAG TPA: uracil-DNA glycosylase [bacterium]|nr:uracil-DNA glycosylase [bacterium]
MTDPRQRVAEYLKWQNTVSPFLLPKELLVKRPVAPAPVAPVAPVASAEPVAISSNDGPATGDGPAAAMTAFAREIAGCRSCRLGETRTNLVFGDGDPHARIMFIGEGPGRDEDLQGVPFVGRAGQLLTKIIESGMKIPRSSVYIANIVKCRPPENRVPHKDEAAACIGHLKRQIAIVRPEAIVLLGKTALQYLLGEEMSINEARQQVFHYEGIRVFVTYHPSALLRNPDYKRPTWEDIKKVLVFLGLPVEN